MLPTLGSFDASPAAVRVTAALAASLTLHAAVALALLAAPPGSPTGQGNRSSRPLQARIVGPAAPEPAPAQPAAAALREARAVPPLEKPAAGGPASSPRTPAEEPAQQPLGLLPEAIHYLPSELDVRPRLRSRVDPTPPPVAPPDGGYVVLQLLISETGEVERVVVAIADPAGFFEKAAIDAFAGARFSPGQRGGIAVKSQTWIELKFHPLVVDPLAPAGVATTGGDGTPR
jgi:TonB family protein